MPRHTASASLIKLASYLLVYLAAGDQDDEWADIGNDPDFRKIPFTWGICRTNVRGWTQRGDDLFFIAKRSALSIEDRYFLRARIRVAEKVGHVEARERFGARQNVILDELPPGPDVRSRVANYIDRWRPVLQWNEGRPDFSLFDSGQWTETEVAVEETPGRWFVHSHWDPHIDWKNRLRSPYVIADESMSRVLREPLLWGEVARQSQFLPKPIELTNRSNRHAAQKVWNRADFELLCSILADAGPLVSSVG